MPHDPDRCPNKIAHHRWLPRSKYLFFLYSECNGALGQFCWPEAGGPESQNIEVRASFALIKSELSKPKEK